MQKAKTIVPSPERKDMDKKIVPLSLRQSVEICLTNYFEHLGDYEPVDVYKMVFDEVELSLLAFMMKHTRQNQSKASEFLGVNRGTLRKKLKQHQLI